MIFCIRRLINTINVPYYGKVKSRHSVLFIQLQLFTTVGSVHKLLLRMHQ